MASDVPSKIPKITTAFLVIKISTTTLGETAGDLFSMTLNGGYSASLLILPSGYTWASCAEAGSRL